MKNVLALSSSRAGGSNFLEPALPLIKNFLGNQELKIAFIPFASVDKDYEQYAAMVQQALSDLPYSIQAVTEENAKAVLENSEVIMTGGGNTFKLLHDLYLFDVLNIIKEKVNNGTPYIGWSAGANIAGRTISTTNDMPIIQPPAFKALNIFPFQINPHYLNQTAVNFHGETRDQRLKEFIKLNLSIPIVGLPEGTALLLQQNKLEYRGSVSAVLFSSNNERAPIKRDIAPGEDISFLLNED